MQVARDVTIWTSEFEAHRVPPVCVKSGRPAYGTWTFPFSTLAATYISPIGARRLRLPLARNWLTVFTALIAVRSTAYAVGIPSFLLASFAPDPPPELRTIWYLFVSIGLIAGASFWFVRPRGSIHSMPTGQTWLLLVGVHPAFVDAVNRSRHEAARVFSEDGRWFWDGSRWLRNDFPEQWWRSLFGGFDKRPRWQVTLGALVVWVAIGALAWWSFHRS